MRMACKARVAVGLWMNWLRGGCLQSGPRIELHSQSSFSRRHTLDSNSWRTVPAALQTWGGCSPLQPSSFAQGWLVASHAGAVWKHICPHCSAGLLHMLLELPPGSSRPNAANPCLSRMRCRGSWSHSPWSHAGWNLSQTKRLLTKAPKIQSLETICSWHVRALLFKTGMRGQLVLWVCLCERSYRVFWNLCLQIALEWLHDVARALFWGGSRSTKPCRRRWKVRRLCGGCGCGRFSFFPCRSVMVAWSCFGSACVCVVIGCFGISGCRSHWNGCVKVAWCGGCMRNTIVFCSWIS